MTMPEQSGRADSVDPLRLLALQLIEEDDELTRPRAGVSRGPVDADQRKLDRFEIINAFIDRTGREPLVTSVDPDERGLAATLNRTIRPNPAICSLASPSDRHGLLKVPHPPPVPDTIEALLEIDDPLLDEPDDALFAPLPVVPDEGSEKSAPERIAERRRCLTFDVWRPVFEKIRADVNSGRRQVTATNATNQIDRTHAFIVDGHIAIIAEVNQVPDGIGGLHDRLRVIYDNGTESDHLLRSFAKALYRDPEARRISHPDGMVGGMFENVQEGPRADIDGHIYVARTTSTAPELADLVDHIVKIGRTGGETIKRMAGAVRDPTFLFAGVRVLRSYALRGYDPKDVEKALHTFFAGAAVNLSMTNGFGRRIDAREWFMVTPEIVDQAVALIIERRIVGHRYDADENRIIENE